MKRLITLLAAAVLLLGLAGCGSPVNYDLPAEPIEFHTVEFTNPDDPEDGYLAIEYKGRSYIPYGTGSVGGKDVGPCLGYIVQEGEVRDGDRIFPLTADPAENYLAERSVGGFMDQPIFYRATDTRGRDVDTPRFIESLEYEYWK